MVVILAFTKQLYDWTDQYGPSGMFRIMVSYAPFVILCRPEEAEVILPPYCVEKRYIHNENTPMQLTAIIHARINDYFHLKIFDLFLIFAQNIDCGYTLEPPQ